MLYNEKVAGKDETVILREKFHINLAGQAF